MPGFHAGVDHHRLDQNLQVRASRGALYRQGIGGCEFLTALGADDGIDEITELAAGTGAVEVDLVIDNTQPVLVADDVVGHHIAGDDFAPFIQGDHPHRLPGNGGAVQAPLLVQLDELHAIGNGALDVGREQGQEFSLLTAKVVRGFGAAEAHTEALAIGIAQVKPHHVVNLDGRHAKTVQVGIDQLAVGNALIQGNHLAPGQVGHQV